MKVSNGMVNDDHVSAVLKIGSNWEMILLSGQRVTLSEADAQQFLPAEPTVDATVDVVGKSKAR